MDGRRQLSTFGFWLFAAGMACGCGGKAAPDRPSKAEPAKVVVPSEKGPENSGESAVAMPDPAAASETSEQSSQSLIDQIDDIGDLGGAAAESLPILREALANDSAEVRWHAARSIGLIGRDAVSVVPELVERLADDDVLVVAQAATAIGRIKEDDIAADQGRTVRPPSESYAKALEALVQSVKHPDARVRRASLLAIKRLHPDRNDLSNLLGNMLSDSEPAVVMAALRSIADVGPPAVPFLAGALQHPQSRYWSAVALTEMGPQAVEAAEELVAAIKEADPVERMQMLLALAAIGEPAAAAAEPLVAMLESESEDDVSLRIPLVYAIGRIRLASAHKSLEKLLESDDPTIAGTAAWARARIHPDAADEVSIAVERLLKGVESADPVIRQGTISALADLSEEVTQEQAGQLASLFSKSLGDREVPVRHAAAESLVRLGAASVPSLVKAVEDPDRRLIAFEVLGSLGSLAKDAVTILAQLLSDPDTTVRSDAAFALGGIGPDAAAAVPELKELLDSTVEAFGHGEAVDEGQANDDGQTHRPVLFTVAYALGRIGPAARDALPTLEKLAQSDHPLVATLGVWSALQIDPGSEQLRTRAVPLLTRALKDSHDLVRLEASIALGEIGQPSHEAIEMLEILADDDPVPTVRSAAAEALQNLRRGSSGSL